MLSSIKFTILLKKNMRQNITRCFGNLYRFNTSYSNTNCLVKRNSSYTAYPQAGLTPFFKEYEYDFMGYFPKVVKSIIDNERHPEMEDLLQRLTKLLEYTVPTGERISGITTVASYKMLEKSENLTQENIDLANVLGWCAELLEAALNLAEDIIGNSETRRNAPSWFKLSNVGRDACFDIFTLECLIFYILKKYFSQHPFYASIIEFFRDVLYKITAGQILYSEKLKIDEMNMNTFNRINDYKSGYSTFYVSITLGMYLSRIYNTELHKQVVPILLGISKYFQIQNDMYRHNSNASINENIGRNIGEGKCTWLIVKALEKADSFQRKIIEDNYGRQEEDAIQVIRNLYSSLDILAEFNVFKEKSFKTLRTEIYNLENISMRNLLYSLIEQVYK